MSQTKFWASNKSSSTRFSPNVGCGQSQTFKMGRYSGDDYIGYVEFAEDWSEVGRIVSATLVTYTDDDTQGTKAKMYAAVITGTWTSGNNVDGHYDSGDYVEPATDTVPHTSMLINHTSGSANRLDVTALIENIAPSTVKKRDGSPGGHQTHHGLRLYTANGDTAQSASVWSFKAPNPAFRPTLEVVYEYGATVPNTPINLAPTGAVAALTTFGADFSDKRPTDTLAAGEVEVYDAGVAATGTGSTNRIVRAAHGLTNGAIIYVTADTGGPGLPFMTALYVRNKTTNDFQVSTTATGAVVDFDDYSAITYSKRVYGPGKKPVSGSETLAARLAQVPTGLVLKPNTTFRWRVRLTDQEGQVSAWTGLTSFSLTNTAPNAPTLTPANASSYASLDGIQFKSGNFSDPDSGDFLLAYEVQLSAFASGSPNWNDDSFILWATGKRYVSKGDRTFSTPYGGQSLLTGTYYWRARVYDSKDTPSAWTYNQIILTADFVSDVSQDTNAIQLRPRAPWRILIKEMKFDNIGGALTGVAATDVITSASAHRLAVGRNIRFSSLTGGAGLSTNKNYYVVAPVTATTFKVSATLGGAPVDFTTAITAGQATAIVNRGPGNTVAIIEDAMNVGASKMYNSPGELHFTISPFHPQISVIEPKQTHYAVEFRQGDGWREVFAGLMWDFDATDSDVVFYGIDYLALLDQNTDINLKTANLDTDYTKGGAKYTNIAVKTIITDQLQRAKNYTNSPVKFIGIATVPSALSTPMSVFSAYQPTLSFVTQLIDSYRAGTGKRTRISVNKTGASTYQFVVVDDPGTTRNNLRLRYGELVQGFRVIPFGKNWATRTTAIGRDRTGINVRYSQQGAPGADEAVWGRFSNPQFFDGVADQSDLARRARQNATAGFELGKQVGLGIRTAFLQPNDGYDLLDKFPVDIKHGAVDTTQFGHNGLWVAAGITWESKKQGEQSTILTLLPTESGSAPSSNLLVSVPISTQQEWQVGWVPAATVAPTAKYWLDQNTGIVYIRTNGTLVVAGITGVV